MNEATVFGLSPVQSCVEYRCHDLRYQFLATTTIRGEQYDFFALADDCRLQSHLERASWLVDFLVRAGVSFREMQSHIMQNCVSR